MFTLEELRKIFSENVRFYREQKNWTQETLAEKSDVSISSIKNIEASHYLPGDKILLKLINAFDIDSSSLFISSKSELVPREQLLELKENIVNNFEKVVGSEKERPVQMNTNHFKRS